MKKDKNVSVLWTDNVRPEPNLLSKTLQFFLIDFYSK